MDAETRKNEELHRYELTVDGQVVGVADFVIAGDDVVLPHTEIAASHRGHGLAAVLVQAALDDVRAAGRRVVPQCWYVAQFVEEHPGYRNLVAS